MSSGRKDLRDLMKQYGPSEKERPPHQLPVIHYPCCIDINSSICAVYNRAGHELILNPKWSSKKELKMIRKHIGLQKCVDIFIIFVAGVTDPAQLDKVFGAGNWDNGRRSKDKPLRLVKK